MIRVRDYATGELLDGYPTTALIAMSNREQTTGAVVAYQRKDGAWLPCPASQGAGYRDAGYRVETLYTEET